MVHTFYWFMSSSSSRLDPTYCAIVKMPTEQEFLGNKEWVKKIGALYLSGYKQEWVLVCRGLDIDGWQSQGYILGIAEEKLKTVREVHIMLASLLRAKSGLQLTEEEFVKAVAKFAANEKESGLGLALRRWLMFCSMCWTPIKMELLVWRSTQSSCKVAILRTLKLPKLFLMA